MPLPRTPTEARAIPFACLGPDTVDEVLANIRDRKARGAMARVIAKHGRKYTAEARDYAAECAERLFAD